ncbi:hypothetical protein C345_03710 [Cryptococcus neoformans A2-102-5]|nr:hypothetical protein C346_03835 [Cryptococcus neoformans var. grubii D17-1]OXG95097.1 hypothetical protein C345_03710 [Cryptococcus neoformans var. grubii A2-102-5]
MPVLIPQLEPPKDADPVAAATTQLLEQVRAMTEWYTNGDSSPSSFIDFAGYRQLQEWAKNPEALNVIDKILQTRLGLSFPYNQKALILVQLIPEDKLAPYAALLKPLIESSPVSTSSYTYAIPLTTTLATSLHSLADGQAKKAEAKKKEDEEKMKWDLRSEVYGKSRADWVGLPEDNGGVKWGWWAWESIEAEEWWKDRNIGG